MAVNWLPWVVIEAVSRLKPDVLGGERSNLEDSFENGLLEYPPLHPAKGFQGTGGCRRCFCPVTMKKFDCGEKNSRSNEPGKDGRICFKRRNCLLKIKRF